MNERAKTILDFWFIQTSQKEKFGHNKIIVSGVFLLFLSILINIFFQTYIGFAIGLILLGFVKKNYEIEYRVCFV